MGQTRPGDSYSDIAFFIINLTCVKRSYTALVALFLLITLMAARESEVSKDNSEPPFSRSWASVSAP